MIYTSKCILLRQTSYSPAIASIRFRCLRHLRLLFPIFLDAATTALKCCYCQQCTNLALCVQFHNELLRRSTFAQIRIHQSLVEILNPLLSKKPHILQQTPNEPRGRLNRAGMMQIWSRRYCCFSFVPLSHCVVSAMCVHARWEIELP